MHPDTWSVTPAKAGVSNVVPMTYKEHNYYVYILTNRNKTTFYVGMTNNLPRRMYEHKNDLIEGFTDKYNLEQLVY